MNDKCKYCDYVSKCSRICEYNSYLCKVHRSFPKVVDKSYEQLQQENKKINGAIQTYDILLKANVEENKQLKRIIKENTILVKDEYGDYQECNINPLRMKQKYEKQVDNWNKLKKWLEKELGDRINPNKDKWLTGVYDAYMETIDKMQELEGSDSK